MNIEDITQDLRNGKIKFHTRVETAFFEETLSAFKNERFITSAGLCATLYEQIFTIRLVMETSYPKEFTPGKDNVEQQLRFLIEREDDIINNNKLRFRDITQKLMEIGVLTKPEKNKHDRFYSKYRNPVAHGLRYRLYQQAYGKDPIHPFEIDAEMEQIYKCASERLIEKIVTLAGNGGFIKQG